MSFMGRPERRPMRIAERIALRKTQLDALADNVVAFCDTQSDIQAVYAYGSYARGTVGIESDLDVLIVRDTMLRRLDRDNDIRAAVRAPQGLDILVVTPEEFSNELAANSVGRHILREAVLLKQYHRSGASHDAA